jgi:hypothetical protein
MLPHLEAVVLNGMKPEDLRFPIGEGTHERHDPLSASGYRGPIGTLGHVEDADKVVLQRNPQVCDDYRP